MSEAVQHGRCLCGAVTVSGRLGHEMSACFCTMCTRWSGTVQMGIDAPADTVTVSGPVKTYRSSPFSERAWCDTCGSALWLRDDGGDYEFVPGLFENAGGGRLTRIVYADRKPDGWDIADGPTRVTAAEYEEKHPFIPEGEMP
ncbi:GFA family protein [Heliomarina baculiformis]|uniref:GFA family protein n=1 Tax=Heliomarina baculiformis TaxID=2872036 RepID=UPI001EE1EAD2